MKLSSTLVLLLFSIGVYSQIEFPPVSPSSKIIQQVGLTELKVSYSRPAARGRKIIGGLVPYKRIWRVGANESTKFSMDTDVKIGGKRLAKGTYALYAFPYEDYWDIIFHTDTTLWGDGRDKYMPEKDALRIVIRPSRTKAYQENFLITFDSITHNGTKMNWLWENTLISIPIEVDTDVLMQASIERALKEQPTAQTYYEAARYLVEQNRDPSVALSYVNRAIARGGETYYFFRVKSLAEAALGNYEKAISSATTSRKIADSLGKDEFVRLNEANILNWQKKINSSRD